jgi:hypothetical protein
MAVALRDVTERVGKIQSDNQSTLAVSSTVSYERTRRAQLMNLDNDMSGDSQQQNPCYYNLCQYLYL